jgi:hypothetical protein
MYVSIDPDGWYDATVPGRVPLSCYIYSLALGNTIGGGTEI